MDPILRMMLLDEETKRRAVFSPLDISGLLLWLRADEITGLDDGDPISTWADLSGNGEDATQGTAAKRPIYRTSVINGLAAVRFDDVDDSLELTLSNGADDYTIYIVLDPNLVGAGADNYLLDFQSGRLVLAMRNNGPNPGDLQGFRDNSDWESFGVAITEDWQYDTWLLEADPSLFRNGVELSSLGDDTYSQRALGGTQRIGQAYFAESQFYDGDIAEMLIYSGAHTAGQLALVHDYLSGEYAI